MHRLHESLPSGLTWRDPGDDLAGHVPGQEPWEVVRLPAIVDQEELHRVETVFGRQSFGRKAGEALHPEREPPEMLEQIRRIPRFIPGIGEYLPDTSFPGSPAPGLRQVLRTRSAGTGCRLDQMGSPDSLCWLTAPPLETATPPQD
jgi:hypothetical protein